MKKRKKITYLLLVLIILVAGFFIKSAYDGKGQIKDKVKTEKTQGEEASSGKEDEEKSSEISLTVDLSEALKVKDKLSEEKKKLLPKDGFILKDYAYKFNAKSSQGMNVFEISKEIFKEKNIEFDYKYSAEYKSNFVNGIGGIKTGDASKTAGWTYTVNGKMPSVGADQFKPNPGDKVVWKYVVTWDN